MAYNRESVVIIFLIYVNDTIITDNYSAIIQRIINKLHYQFVLKDLGSLSYFLDIEITSMQLSQSKYIQQLFEKAQL